MKQKLFHIILIYFLSSISVSVFGQTIDAKQKTAIDKFIVQAKQFEAENNYNQAASLYNKGAYLYWNSGLSEQAIELFSKSLELNKKLNNNNAVQVISNNIGMIYVDLEKYNQALSFLSSSLEIRKQAGNKVDICSQKINIASVLAKLDKIKQSNKLLEEALSLATELNHIGLIKSCYGQLSDNYKVLGETEKHFEYFNLYNTFNKKLQDDREQEILNRANSAEAQTLETRKELETQTQKLKHKEDSLKQVQLQVELLNKQKALNEARLKEQEAISKNEKLFGYYILTALALSVLLIVVGLYSYRKNARNMKRLAQQNKEIEKKNVEITQNQQLIEDTSREMERLLDSVYSQNIKMQDSIKYAVNIQKAMLPEIDSFKNLVKESFIWLKPRDMVSGDFYWFKKLDDIPGGENKFLAAAVDCTGHGVPGAFMSVIGVNILNNITNKGIIRPDLILHELDKRIVKSLKQESSENKDGMDMALIVFDTKTREICFAGANNPLIYFQDGKMNIIKGEKIPIGGSYLKEKEKLFKCHHFKLDKPTTCYIFSDGYQDQFGGPKKRKFMFKRLKELLTQIHKKTMPKQKEILKSTYENWKGKRERQIDDVLVMGMKL